MCAQILNCKAKGKVVYKGTKICLEHFMGLDKFCPFNA